MPEYQRLHIPGVRGASFAGLSVSESSPLSISVVLGSFLFDSVVLNGGGQNFPNFLCNFRGDIPFGGVTMDCGLSKH